MTRPRPTGESSAGAATGGKSPTGRPKESKLRPVFLLLLGWAAWVVVLTVLFVFEKFGAELYVWTVIGSLVAFSFMGMIIESVFEK